MERKLVYNGVVYEHFSITEYGEIKNLSTNHIYKHSVHKTGYYVVYLPMGTRGKTKATRVHKAVAETYIPNPQNLPFVHHKDENKRNPCYTNLEWVTAKRNTEYHLKELEKHTAYYNNRKLNADDINLIRAYANSQMSHRKIAEIFNVSKTTISRVLNGRSYKEIPC